MNSQDIKAKILQYCFYHRKYRPGVTEWENRDVAVLTPNRELIEFEVKISLADLKADEKKAVKHWLMKGRKYGQEGLDNSVPMRFYYAIPENLADKALEIINEKYPYAGLAAITAWYPFVRILKTGKRLNSNPISESRFLDMVDHLAFEVVRLRSALAKMELHSETSSEGDDMSGQPDAPLATSPA